MDLVDKRGGLTAEQLIKIIQGTAPKGNGSVSVHGPAQFNFNGPTPR
jgi:hypothetical protein